MNGFISDFVRSAQWLPEGFVGELLPFVVAAWEMLVLPTQVTDEDKITARFRRLLKRRIRSSEHQNWMVLREVPVEDEEKGDIGWNDIRVLPPDSRDEDYAFVFECKRLNVTFPNGKFRHNADAYVGKGMMRFITGQYSTSLHEAGMLGYVMDGNTTGAHTRVVRAILARATAGYGSPRIADTRSADFSATSRLTAKRVTPWGRDTNLDYTTCWSLSGEVLSLRNNAAGRGLPQPSRR